MNKLFCTLAGITLALSASSATMAASAFPNRPIELIVPVAPGGGTDFTARILADEMSKILGQTVIVKNKPGGAGNLGVTEAAQAPADGYTLVMPITSFPINATLYKNLPFDTEKDLAPVALAASLPLVLVVNPNVQAKSVRELVLLAKAKPGTLNFANSGVGTTAHLAGELLKKTTGTDIVSVAYKGGNPAVSDLIGGYVDMYFSTPTSIMPQIEAGKLRALAVTSNTRLAELPDVPTFKEAGYPDLQVKAWFGVFAPAGTPHAIIATLNRTINEALSRQNVRKQMAAHSVTVEGKLSPDELGAYLVAEINQWGKIIADLKLTANS